MSITLAVLAVTSVKGRSRWAPLPGGATAPFVSTVQEARWAWPSPSTPRTAADHIAPAPRPRRGDHDLGSKHTVTPWRVEHGLQVDHSVRFTMTAAVQRAILLTVTQDEDGAVVVMMCGSS